MHAYLLVGEDHNKLFTYAESLSKKQKSKLFEYPVKTIKEVRELEKFTKLKLTQPTTIYIEGIDKASLPTLNAFLKTLEEPQEGLYFVLTTSRLKDVIPTIISRSHVIKIEKKRILTDDDKKNALVFINSDISKKLATISDMRDRNDAIYFLENIILTIHEGLQQSDKKEEHADIIEAADAALVAIKANGNISLQLTNFVISI